MQSFVNFSLEFEVLAIIMNINDLDDKVNQNNNIFEENKILIIKLFVKN